MPRRLAGPLAAWLIPADSTLATPLSRLHREDHSVRGYESNRKTRESHGLYYTLFPDYYCLDLGKHSPRRLSYSDGRSPVAPSGRGGGRGVELQLLDLQQRAKQGTEGDTDEHPDPPEEKIQEPNPAGSEKRQEILSSRE
jgi:hypothetical protein